MAEKQVTTVPVVPDVIERARGFWAKNSKAIMIAGSALILLAGAYLGYKYLYKIPRENKASELIFPAEKLYDKMSTTSSYGKDTLNLVLNGGNLQGQTITGLLKIISQYDGTLTANRAHYIVGACYLQLKEFDKAIKHLKKFEGHGASQIESKAYIMLGLAYSEQKKTDDALRYFKKAAAAGGPDAGMVTEALYLGARYAETVGKSKDAIEMFKRLKEDYPASQHVSSGDVDRYLGKLGVTN